jgi:hypothetical protein
MWFVYGVISVLSVGLVAGPSSPARLDLRTEDSTSCGANLLLPRRGGEGERGEGLGVSSPGGALVRYFSNVVSMGIGANRSRGRSRVLAIAGRGSEKGRWNWCWRSTSGSKAAIATCAVMMISCL